jgi:hypothetical protein
MFFFNKLINICFEMSCSDRFKFYKIGRTKKYLYKTNSFGSPYKKKTVLDLKRKRKVYKL